MTEYEAQAKQFLADCNATMELPPMTLPLFFRFWVTFCSMKNFIQRNKQNGT